MRTGLGVVIHCETIGRKRKNEDEEEEEKQTLVAGICTSFRFKLGVHVVSDNNKAIFYRQPKWRGTGKKLSGGEGQHVYVVTAVLQRGACAVKYVLQWVGGVAAPL